MKQNTTGGARSGFTIIEVTVVLSILAIFTSIVVFAVGLSRAKAEDARTKEVLASIRTSATEEYTELASFTTVCASGKTHTLITTFAEQRNLSITDYICVADPIQFAVLFPLEAESGYWCVDSTGNSKRVSTADDPLSSKSCGPPPVEGEGGGEEEEEEPGGNLPPIANAGTDTAITLPVSTVSLDGSGSDLDGSIVSYTWTKISGTGGTIESPLLPDTDVTGLSAGVYVFQLAVTDNGDLVSSDQVQVTVNAGVDNPVARTLTAMPGGMTLSSYYGQVIGFYESLPRGYYNDPSKEWPLLVFLHGVGESGNGTTQLSRVIRHGPGKHIDTGSQLEYEVDGETESFVVIIPQALGGTSNWHPFQVNDVIEYAKSNYNIDTDRIYLTGLSMGGYGVISYAAFSPDYTNSYSNKIAALAATDGGWGDSDSLGSIWTPGFPLNGGNAQLDICYINAANIPAWLFRGTSHEVYAVNNANTQLGTCTPALNPAHLFTNYTDVSRAWDRAYWPDHTYENPNLYEWFLEQSL